MIQGVIGLLIVLLMAYLWTILTSGSEGDLEPVESRDAKRTKRIMKVTGKGRGKLRFADREEGELTPGSGSSDSGQARGPPPVEPPRLGLGPGKLFPGVKGDPPVSGKFGKGRGRARARVDDAAPLGTKAVDGGEHDFRRDSRRER